MNRALVFLAATAAAALAVTSACLASPKTNHDFRAENIYFTMTAPARSGDVQLSLRSGNDRHNHNMSRGFAASELAGLDLARLGSPASTPLSFALIRQAGRVDCAGNARAMKVDGDCRFTPDYIDGMARAGFRNMDADAIVQFKALDISPAYIAELARIGYSGLDPDEVTQLKALEVTPEFVEGFARIGYSNLPVETLVQLKALDVTPEYVKSLRDRGLAELSPEQLVALRAVGQHYGRRK